MMNYQALSSIISLLFHTAIVISIVHVNSLIPSHQNPLLINFSIERAPASSKVPEMTREVNTAPKSLPKIRNKAHKVRPAAKKKEVLKAKLPDTNVPEVKERQPIQKESDAAVLPKDREIVQEKIIPNEAVEEKIVHNNVHEDTPAAIVASTETSSNDSAAWDEARDDFREHARSQYIKQHYKYISRIVQGNISYPYMARKMSWEGRVVLSFIIKGDGNVKDICLERSSGFDVLDNNAKETVRNTAPFPPPVVEAKIILPIVYRLL